jgi:hypothetical protein
MPSPRKLYNTIRASDGNGGLLSIDIWSIIEIKWLSIIDLITATAWPSC